MYNTQYDSPFHIAKALSIIRLRHPNQQVGDYVRHTLSADGRGLKVMLTNGSILVTYEVLAAVYDAQELGEYMNHTIQTFVPDPPVLQLTVSGNIKRIEKFLKYVGKKTGISRQR
jgi:hypothetical protein